MRHNRISPAFPPTATHSHNASSGETFFAFMCAFPLRDAEAEIIFRGCYLCVGEPVPTGGLFGSNPEYYDDTRFWNEVNL